MAYLPVKIIENSGESIENAIIILGAEGSFDGVSYEYQYLNEFFNKAGLNFKVLKQTLLCVNNKYYDKLEVEISNGEKRAFYFDITDFFGKI